MTYNYILSYYKLTINNNCHTVMQHMNSNYIQLRVDQLQRQLESFMDGRKTSRPAKGWLYAMRQVSGITLRDLAVKLKIRHQTVAALEKSEAEDRITLKRLKEVAEQMDCQLVYAIVPRNGSIEEFAMGKDAQEVRRRAMAVSHTMALENQPVNNVEEKIQAKLGRRFNYGAKKID
jgi:predicted DNA-binding mobile mystery protein A